MPSTGTLRWLTVRGRQVPDCLQCANLMESPKWTKAVKEVADWRRLVTFVTIGDRRGRMAERAWRFTEEEQLITEHPNRIPDYDPRSGEHLWTVALLFRIVPTQWADPTSTPRLDRENMLSVTPPGCYYCERVWSPWLAARRCPGEPRGRER